MQRELRRSPVRSVAHTRVESTSIRPECLSSGGVELPAAEIEPRPPAPAAVGPAISDSRWVSVRP